MTAAFYVAAAVAVVATLLAVTRPGPFHGLLYLIVSLLAVATVLWLLGAPFAAALEVIVYAGAIMVLFLFVLMMLNAGEGRGPGAPKGWLGPACLCAVLLAEMAVVVTSGDAAAPPASRVGARPVALLLFGPYLLAVEIASMLLLAGLVGAYAAGRRVGDRHGRRPDPPEGARR